MENCCPFGIQLREERKRRNIPLWKFAATVPYPVSNVQRIETGVTEPRIGIAMKMLAALDVDVGAFMQTLAEAQDWQQYDSPNGYAGDKLASIVENMMTEDGILTHDPKLIYVLFFRRVRVSCKLTQAVIADRANYTVRSLIYLEGGKQEPMIMGALKLAWATGIGVKDFFGSYATLLANISSKQ